MAPYFSVILPIYNVERYLQRCVQSVLSQKFTDYEMILVDDGATDASPALCEQLAAAHSCIRVIHKENGGLSSARNAGLQAADGRYIWWVDSDDWIAPDALQILYDATENSPDMVKFNHFRVEGSKNTEICSQVAPGCYTPENRDTLLEQATYKPGRFVLSAWSHIYRRGFLTEKRLAFVSERLVGSEDYLFNLESYLQSEKTVVLPDALYSYDLRLGSLSQTYKKDLPVRYERLYRCLREQYRRAGVLEKYQGDLSAFYLWHLLHGTCIPNEYFQAPSHSMQEGRKNVKEFLSAQSVREAYAYCDKSRFSYKKRLQLWAMKMRCEWFFYWLYVKKPGKRKVLSHENKTETA